MLDIKNLVENKKEVEAALLKRMSSEKLDLDKIIETYEEYKEAQKKFEFKRSEQNAYNDDMAKVLKGSDEFTKLVGELKKISNEVKDLESKARELEKELNTQIGSLPNIPDEDVVAGGKEKNKILKSVGKKPLYDFKIKDHVEVGENLGLFDFERAARLAGAQMPMYRSEGAMLEWALLNYFINFHKKGDYEMILPPHILSKESGYVAGQFPKFEDDVYLTNTGDFLLPTAETALVNMYRDECLDEEDLPKKFFAFTPCYRKEAGGYRTNERGLMRVHQFNKVELLQFTKEEDSDKALEEMVSIAEKLVASLGLHYNVVQLAAEDCSAAMSKTIDIEVYLPYFDKYQEVSSISNARTYQARRGNMRYKPKDGSKTKYMHTLNASGLATSRLMVAIIETYQNEDGSLTIPEVLREFMGKDKIEVSNG